VFYSSEITVTVHKLYKNIEMSGCYFLLNLTEKSEIFEDKDDDSPMVT